MRGLPTRKSLPKLSTLEKWSDPLDLASTHSHQSLTGTNNIRLLTYIPSKSTGTLSCSLTVHSLDWAPSRRRFNALSYAWRENETIPSLNGRRHLIRNGRVIEISQTLHDVLYQLWAHEPDQRLWVDSLCINQEDIEERNTQVNMMARIYGDAAKVIIWLGSILFDDFEAMQGVWQALPIANAFHSRQHTIIADNFLPEPFANNPGPFWRAFHNLISRSWLTRAWVFQEVMLAGKADVHIGPLSLPWSVFAAGANWIGSCCMAAIWLRHDFSRLYTRNALCRAGAVPLSQLLVDIQSRDASDVKDKVNAVLAMHFSGTLRADYSRSVEETFIAATRYCISRERSLGLLEIAGTDARQVPIWGDEDRFRDFPGMIAEAQDHHEDLLGFLPSWVPDFGTPNWNRHHMVDLNNMSVNMLGLPSAIVGEPDYANQIVLRGCVVGEIFVSNGEKKLRLLPPCLGMSTTESRLRDLLWTANPHEVANTSSLLTNVFRHDNGKCSCEAPSEIFLPLIIAQSPYSEFETVEQGDFLCVLLGARVPFVLRLADKTIVRTPQPVNTAIPEFRIACAATEQPKSMRKWLEAGNFGDLLRCVWLDFRLI